jgi:periplasmic divalent cation tolerance protein
MVSGKGKRVVLVTCSTLKEARKIANSVVGAGLAACVNIGAAPVESVYRWKGKIETAREFLLVIKTTAARLTALEKEVKRLHSYDVPEFVVLEISAGSKEYLQWVEERVGRER